MSNFLDRKLFKNTNKYQIRIIRMSAIPAFLFCAFLSYFCVELLHEQMGLMNYGTRMMSLYVIDKFLVFILITLWGMFIYLFYLSYRISLQIVGPFTRINKELDLVIRGESRHHIKVRDEDHLALEVLERVNILIDNLPPPNMTLKVR